MNSPIIRDRCKTLFYFVFILSDVALYHFGIKLSGTGIVIRIGQTIKVEWFGETKTTTMDLGKLKLLW